GVGDVRYQQVRPYSEAALRTKASTKPCGPQPSEVRCDCRNREGEGVLTHTITLIPGDGTGPEIVEATRRAIEATGVKIEWDVHGVGVAAMAKGGRPLPRAASGGV